MYFRSKKVVEVEKVTELRAFTVPVLLLICNFSFGSGPEIRNPELQIRIDKQYKQFELFQR
jgi:hypothetical protein